MTHSDKDDDKKVAKYVFHLLEARILQELDGWAKDSRGGFSQKVFGKEKAGRSPPFNSDVE
jgi:hypothetical protein